MTNSNINIISSGYLQTKSFGLGMNGSLNNLVNTSKIEHWGAKLPRSPISSRLFSCNTFHRYKNLTIYGINLINAGLKVPRETFSRDQVARMSPHTHYHQKWFRSFTQRVPPGYGLWMLPSLSDFRQLLVCVFQHFSQRQGTRDFLQFRSYRNLMTVG